MAKKTALAESYKINIDPAIFNPVYFPYLEKIYRYEVFFGGSSSGKSNFIAHMLALQLTTMEGRNLICLRHQGTDVRDSCYTEIYSAMAEMHLLDMWDIVEHPMPRLTNKLNGNTIAFSGLDSVENVKSIKFKNGNLTDIWYEEVTEEPTVKSIRELDRRLRGFGKRKRMILSFNPIFSGHWLKDFIEVELKGTDCLVLRTTYKDNKFLNAEDIAVLERYKYSDPYSYMVYALGQWGVTGKTVFDANKVNLRLTQLLERDSISKPLRAQFIFDRDDDGNILLDTFRMFTTPDGETCIYKKVEPGHPYVLAFDTAGEGADFYAGHVVDNSTGEQVAVFHSEQQGPWCIPQLYGLARYYNEALVCPEVNFDPYAITKLQEMKYHKLYVRDAHPERLDAQKEPKLGWRTSPENRQMMLTAMVDWVAEHINLINDVETLNEMLTFTRQPVKTKGIFWAAEPGAHDDLVMSFAILLQAREQQKAYVESAKPKIEGIWLPEELEFAVLEGTVKRVEARKHEMVSASMLGMKTPEPKLRGRSNQNGNVRHVPNRSRSNHSPILFSEQAGDSNQEPSGPQP